MMHNFSYQIFHALNSNPISAFFLTYPLVHVLSPEKCESTFLIQWKDIMS